MRKKSIRSRARSNRLSAGLLMTASCFALAAGLPGGAQAADRYWDANQTNIGLGGIGTWNLSNLFWSPNGDGVSGPFVTPWSNAAFDNAIFAGTAGTVTLGAPITANALTFNVHNYVLSGSTLTLGGATPTITGAGNATINSILAGTSGLTKAGSGILTLTGANTFSGGITLNAGTISAATDAALGALGNNITTAAGVSTGLAIGGATNTSRMVTIGTNGTLILSGAGAGSALITGDGNLNVGTGVRLTNNANTYTGTTRFNACNGTCATYFSSIADLGQASALGAPNTVANGTITFAQSSQYTDSVVYTGSGNSSNRNWSISGAGAVIRNQGSGTLTLAGDIANSGGTTFSAESADIGLSGVISGPANIAFSGNAGRSITLGVANTYTGASSIGGITLPVGVLADGGTASSLGAGSIINLGNNAGLSYIGASVGTNRTWTNQGAAAIRNDGTGALTLTGDLAFVAGGAADTLSLGGSYTGADNAFSGVISGAGNLVVAGPANWVLSGANTFTGGVTLNGGALRLGGAASFLPTTGFIVNGGVLDLNGFDLTTGSITGTGGAIALGGNTLTVNATTAQSYAGALTGTGGLTKAGAATLTLAGASTYTGSTTISGGKLSLDFSGAGGPTNDILAPTAPLVLSGGALDVIGAAGESNSQSFGGVTVAAGSNTIRAVSGTSLNVNLGALNRTSGLINFVTPAAGAITTSNGDGALGGWATINGADYAKVLGGSIVAFDVADYTNQDDASAWAAGQVISDAANAANTAYFGTVGASVQLGGLLYEAAAPSTVTVAGGATLGVDGTIIVAPSVLANNQTIAGGSLTGGAGGGTLGLQQNGAGVFTIGSTIVDNGVGTGFIKGGTGTAVLTGANTYTGVTTVTDGVLSVSSIGAGGAASGIGQSTAASSNLVLEGGELKYTGGTATTDRGFTLVNGSATRTIDVTSATANLTFAGQVTSADNASFTKTGAGTLTLANGTNNYGGATTVSAGTLSVGVLANGGVASGIGASSSASSNLTLQGGGGLQYTGGTATTNRGFTLGAGGGVIDVSNGPTTLTMSGTVVGGASQTLTKEGGGTLVLSGTNSGFTAGGYVNAGVLRAGSAQAFGTGGWTVASGAALDLNGFSNTVAALAGAGAANLGSATLTINSGGATFSGAITGAGGVTKTGGFSQTFSGCSNGYTGPTAIAGGTLSVDCLANGGVASGIGASGASSSNLAISGGGNLLYTGPSIAIDRGVTLSGGDGYIGVNAAATTLGFGGAAIGSGRLRKSGAGVLVLSGANTYSGSTVVDAGVLRAGSTSAFGTGGVTMSNVAGATLDLAGFSNQVSFLSGGGLIGGNIELGSANLTIGGGPNASFSGAINGSGGLLKTGAAGVQDLAGCGSSYTGPTVINAGMLSVSCLTIGLTNSSIGASSSAASNLVINGGALRYAGAGNATDRQFTLGAAANSTLDSSGTGAVNFTSTTPLTFSGTGARTLTLTGNNVDDNVLAAHLIDPAGGVLSVTKATLSNEIHSLWRLSNPNSTYTGATTIIGGVLSVDKLSNGGQASSIGASSNAASKLVIGNTSTLRYTGAGDTTDRLFSLNPGVTFIESSGTGAAKFVNTGAVTLLTAGQARTIALGGTNGGDNTLGGSIGNATTGVTTLAKNDAGKWILTGTNTYTGSTNINGGTLQLGDGGTTGSTVSALVNNFGALAFNRSNAYTYAGTVVGTGSLSQLGAGTTTLTGANTYTGGTTIGAGVLQLGAGGSTGSIVGDVVDNGTLAFNRSDTVTFSGLVSGTGAVNKLSSGTTILSANNSYAGATTVSAGTLRINGNQSAATGLTTVNSGATLGGSGTIGGGVVVQNGGALAAGNSPGTLTINGDLQLNATSNLNFELGQANMAGGPLNDLINVGGALTLDGVLNISVSPGGTFGPGIYRLFNYGGALTDNGLAFGSTPGGSLAIQTAIAGQVNLTNTAGGAMSFWDGPVGPQNDGLIQGGAGTWRVGGGGSTWTQADGAVNFDYAQDGFAVFAGSPGTVTVDSVGGAVRASGLQFAVNGYTIAGAELGLTGAQATVRVGDGTSAGAGMTATIGSVVSGASQLAKTDLGTLVLTGANTYTGGTAIKGGLVSISNNANLGDAAGGLTLDGGTLRLTSSLALTRAVTLGPTGGTIQANSFSSVTGGITGIGGFTKAGVSTLTLLGTNTYSGGTTISAGTLSLGSGATTGSIVGDVLNNGSLIFSNPGTQTFNGVISGSGQVRKTNTGTEILTGTNSYAGLTTVSAGTLLIDGDQSLATGATTVGAAATLGGTGTIGGDVTVANGATIAPGGATSAPGELKILGDLTLAGGASLKYDFGQANVPGGPLNDLASVSGDLTLGGTLDVVASAGGSFDAGLYRVMNYGGTLSGTLTVGAIPATTNFFLQTSVANQVNLVNTNGLTLNFWDGDAGTRNDGVISGGDGVWKAPAAGAPNDSWTLDTAALNAPYTNGAFAVFAGAPGTVAVDQTAGAVNAAGMQFAVNGYVLDGDPLNLTGAQATIRVGDGTAAGGVMTTVINAPLVGAAGVVKSDLGTLTFTGANSYAGATTVNAGTLLIDGDQSAATGLTTVNAAATLGGSGTIGGDVTVADAGVLAAGDGSPGTLTIKGALNLNPGSVLNFQLGQAGVVGGALNDLVNVGGALTLDGALNVSASAGGSFGPGVYRLFNFAGALTNNGLTIGAIPSSGPFAIQTAVANQVNLTNAAGLNLNFWDGPGGSQNDGAIQGGSGTWSAGAGPTAWTDQAGGLNADYAQASFAVFTGSPGTVTIDNAAAGPVQAAGLQFAADGYVLTGDALTLAGGAQSTIRVGDGSAASAGMTATLDAPVTGATQLVKTDLGKLILGGANSYTGGTAINGGVLSVAQDANLGDAAGALSFDGGALQNTGAFFTGRAATLNASGGTFQTDAELTAFGAVSGVGALTKSGSATLVLGADNTYSGGTTIQGGTLQFGDGGTTGSITGDVANNGTLAFDRSNAVSFGGVISGSGSVSQLGAGMTTLTATNSYAGGTTIAAGTLKGSAASFGSGSVLDNAALVIDQASDAAFANAISGTGSLTKIGAGRLNYTGAATLTGPTTVAAGTLAVNGSLAQSAVEVQSGATLGGNGTVGTTIIRSGASAAPGNSIGTLHVAGNLLQQTGSIFQVEVDPNSSASDLITTTGTATIQPGAGLNVTKTAPGNYRLGTVYTVLDAAGGRTGTYTLSGEIADLTGFLALKDSYDAGHAYLTVVQTNTIGSVAETPNQGGVAGGLPSGPVKDAILNSGNPDQARNGLDQLSGDGHAGAKGTLVNDSRLVRDLAVDRLRDILCAEGSLRAGRDEGACPNDPDRAALWGQAFSAWGQTQGKNGNVNRSIDGFLIGLDLPIAKFGRLGYFGGYSRSNLTLHARTGDAGVANYHLGVYGGGQKGRLGLRFGAIYTWQDIDTFRRVALPNFSNALRSTYDAGTGQAFGEVGYRLDFGGVAVEPFLNAAYVSVKTSAFNEWGGAAALSARSDETHNTFATLGARPSANVTIGSAKATIRGLVGWRHAFGEMTPRQTVAFAGGPDFVIQGAAIARDAGVLEFGADVRIGGSGTVGFTYGGQYSDRVVDQSVRGQFTLRF